MQSILGALLTAGYAATVSSAIADPPESGQITDSVQSQLTKSFSSAANLAEQYPQYSQQIIAGAKSSFVDGADWAYTAGVVAIVLGAVLVFVMFPRRDQERRLLAQYQGPSVTSAGPPHAEQGVRPPAEGPL